MTRFVKKALSDIRANRFLNLITIITISLSILVVSVFLLFFENVGRVIEAWNQGGRAMIYLSPDFSEEKLNDLEKQIQDLGGVEKFTFIPKSLALERLKNDMASKTEFFNTLKDNPLPDAVEIHMENVDQMEDITALAKKIEMLPLVESIEYGQGWLGRFLKIYNLFKMTGYVMCGIFLLIALFITANTVRLAFYSRKLEVEIMRLVGATEWFIKLPFYVEGVLQGFLGGILGLGILLGAFLTFASGLSQNLAGYVYIDIQFLSFKAIILLVASSTFLGWFGCYLSLKQILK